MTEIEQLKHAIDQNHVASVAELMSRNPELHRGPLGYDEAGPLTWVAECRVPWEPPTSERLAIAEWMLNNGSDIHQGGEAPLARAALYGVRIPMMELLLARGADVNANSVIFAPCETLDAASLQWLLKHGANPNLHPVTALDYVIGSYVREPYDLHACINVLLEAGGTTKYKSPAVMAILRGRLDLLKEELDNKPTIIHRQFPELDFGTTGGRMLTLKGATLLHVAAEYGNLEAAKLLLDRGADVNAPAGVDEAGVGDQTAIFHAATQSEDKGLAMVQMLIERDASLSMRVKLPGHYERPGEVVECTPLDYAKLFPGSDSKTVEMLQHNVL